ncbi:DUF6891 domain-containing protein [Nocardioides yefusunii]|uniref:DUF6891 domain-containing protein n=1 Tax=Nocardioides yefusunii TaxID=2500546 RepID=A0ABW1R1G1_9ACTN|nr:hypothetical protein [Nocardioides yefusunii]
MSESRAERDLRDSARLMVRAGLVPETEQEQVFAAMVAELMPDTDPTIMAKGWLLAARREYRTEAAAWTAPTDHDRLRAAMSECQRHDIPVLAGVDDVAEVRNRVEQAPTPLRGIIWFSERAVWDAVLGGRLELGLRHGTGHPVQPGDQLAAAVLGCLERHGLQGVVRPGAVDVACSWQRRP